uniref:RRM domain-containing protein n=1 Tax=Bionectria ochroleuca TaxID=29856 RepID=A0A8H7NDN6_BIOOC
MAAQSTPQVISRRGNANGSRSSHDNPKGRGNENAGSRSGRDRSSQEKSAESTKAPKPSKPKAQNEGEKLVIRRLPPAMTQDEFVTILGSDWELNKGKVDWLSYAPGKVSKDPSKPSRPSRAYVHLKRKDDIMSLSEVVQSSTWEDAKGTFTSPALIAPPTVEFAIYKKIPSNKRRTDARQGTIDQDPQFMAFLENLANTGLANEGVEAEDADEAEKADIKVTTTPLIEYLKEKKASKAKDSSSGKNSKKDKESNSSKGKGGSKDDESSKKKGKGGKDDKEKDKAPKETVKILTKKAATEQAAEAAKTAASHITAAASADTPKSRRAGIAAAARILQRDLGLSPGSAHRRARQDAAKAEAGSTESAGAKGAPTAAASSAAPANRSSSPAPSVESTAQSTKQGKSGRRSRGGKNADKGKGTETTATETPTAPTITKTPIILKKKPEPEPPSPQTAPEPAPKTQPTPPAKQAQSTPKSKPSQAQKKAPAVSANTTRAFIKHANASQGVTEALLKQTFETFGTITFVEIDKRKGFAYVDFADHEGLVKAISASPVTVGQANVQVLERKEKKAPAPTQAGSSSSGNPNNNAASSASANGTSAPAQEKPEKSSGRGRRGRGGGNKAAASGDKPSQAASGAKAAGTTPNTTSGGEACEQCA